MKVASRAGAVVAGPGAAFLNTMRGDTGLTLVGWHRISCTGGGLSTAYDDFRRHLDTLERWGARVFTLADAVDRLVAGTLPPRAVALTFDDGYASVLDLAWPELRRRDLPATLFAVSGYLDGQRRFPWDRDADARDARLADAIALRDAADDGLDIGSHTVTHRWLPHLDAAEVGHELLASRHELEDLIGRRVTSLAYPMGGWNKDIRDQADAVGYERAVTVERGRNRDAQHPLSLRRAFAFDAAADFRRQLDGAFDWMRHVERWRNRRAPR